MRRPARATPPRGPITPAVVRGEALFHHVGCATCHIPSLKSGPHAVPSMNQVDVPLFSDLLVHYMGGALNDHIVEGAASGGRWRTAPLWGLRFRTFLLHDGRTADRVAAISAHGGESGASRRRFYQLSRSDRSDLLDS